MDDFGLFNFVKQQSGDHNADINMETRLEDDLGVRGDDAVDFLTAYSKLYNVDLSNFMAADYFSAEGSRTFCDLIDRLFGIPEKRKSFTVGCLYKGILAGCLDEEVINK